MPSPRHSPSFHHPQYRSWHSVLSCLRHSPVPPTLSIHNLQTVYSCVSYSYELWNDKMQYIECCYDKMLVNVCVCVCVCVVCGVWCVYVWCVVCVCGVCGVWCVCVCGVCGVCVVCVWCVWCVCVVCVWCVCVVCVCVVCVCVCVIFVYANCIFSASYNIVTRGLPGSIILFHIISQKARFAGEKYWA
jgi:hypothetical protein